MPLRRIQTRAMMRSLTVDPATSPVEIPAECDGKPTAPSIASLPFHTRRNNPVVAHSFRIGD
jgi:hypothetical protein